MTTAMDVGGGGASGCFWALFGICPVPAGGSCSERSPCRVAPDHQKLEQLEQELLEACLRAEIEKKQASGQTEQARGRIEQAKSWGLVASVSLTVALGVTGLCSVFVTGSGIEYGGGVASAAATALGIIGFRGKGGS